MPAPNENEEAFEAFLAKVPEAPSSGLTHEEPAADAEAPKGPPPAKRDSSGRFSTATTDPPEPPAAAADAGSPPPAPPKPRVRRASDESDPSAKTPPEAPDPSLVLQALRSGDLDTLGELLGEDPALYDEKTPKWAARQRKEAKLIAERDRVVAQAETVVNRWSPVSRSVEALDTNPAELFNLVGMLTGKDPDVAWTEALRARGSVDPRVPALTKAVTDRDARLAELEAERAKRADQAFYETLRDEVDAKDIVRQIDGWEARVAEVLRESVDPDLGEPKLSVRQAAARVVRREREEYERRAKVFGGGEPAPRPKRERAPERAGGTAPAKVRKMSRDEWLAARANG